MPLEHHYMVGKRLHPMHVDQGGVLMPNPYVVSLDQNELRTKTYYRRGSGLAQHQNISRPREGYRRVYVPRREEVVEVLADAGMLPAIYFVFSRAGCDRSVRWLRESGVRLTSSPEAERIREVAEARAAWIDEADLVTLGFYDFLEGLTAGIAAHHAGMLPVFKETVEELFEAGLVKVVFATETLSLGINMPAKTVVIEDLWKFQGERHELLTPGEYTQLTGRAGRRGIDALGHAVVLYQRQVPFERVAGLAATRTYDLSSSFRPSYNMAVNLVRNYTPEEAHSMLNSSFAQFLTDRGVVALERARGTRPASTRGVSQEHAVRTGQLLRVLEAVGNGPGVARARYGGQGEGSFRCGARGGYEPAARRRDTRLPIASSRLGGRGFLQRRKAHRAVTGPLAVSSCIEGFPGSARGADAHRVASIGQRSQRSLPA